MSDTSTRTVSSLRFNNLMLDWIEGLTLTALLEAQGVKEDAVATAVNGTFVPRAQRASTLLKPHDTVLTFQAIVGG